MSINLGNAADNTWKRVRLQHVTLAAGLALAVSSAIAIGGWQSDGVAVPSPAIRSLPADVALTRWAETPQVVFYIAATQAQVDFARAIEQEAEWIRWHEGVSEPNRSVVLLMAGTPAEEARALNDIDRAMAAANFTSEAAPAFQVVDLR